MRFTFLLLILVIYSIPAYCEEISLIGYDLSDIENDDDHDQHMEVNDPLEPVNRNIFYFNKGVDELLIKPAAKTYDAVIPDWGKDRVDSFINNIYEPLSFFNAILQGNGELAAKNAGRFLTNTTVGLGGLFDIAATGNENLSPQYTDFGLTLAYYGVSSGPYLVLPILGPSSARDVVGLGVDWATDPFNLVVNHEVSHRNHRRSKVKTIRYLVETIHTRYKLLSVEKDLLQNALDEYATIRSVYLQKRNSTYVR